MASIKVQFDLSGEIALKNALAELEPKLAKGAIKTALRESAKVILRGAKFRAPHDSGDLAKSLKVKAFKRTRKNVIGFSVGIAAGDYKGKTFYGSFQEFGWTPVAPGRASGVRSDRKFLKKENTNGAFVIRDGSAKTKAITAAKIRLAKHGGKKIPGKKFIQKSFKENAQQIKADLVAEIYKGINKELDKVGK